MSRAYIAPAIGRAAAVLKFLSARSGLTRLSDVARELDCGKSSALGILRSLEEIGWVEKDLATGGYRLGAGLWQLTRKAFGARDVAAVVRPLLEQLAKRGGESAFLGFLRGDRILIEDYVEGGHEMCVAARPGGTLPLFAGATAKVLLAGMSEDVVRTLVCAAPLPRYTEHTLTDPVQLLAAVAEARARGYALDEEEYLRGVRAVAAPVTRGSETVGVIWVAGFSTRLTDARLAVVRGELLAAVRVCNALLEPGGAR